MNRWFKLPLKFQSSQSI